MTPHACETARELLLEEQRGVLPPEPARALREHLQTCEACARVDAEERVVSELLRSRLNGPLAPAELKAKLAARVLAGESRPPAAATVGVPAQRARRSTRVLMAAFAALAACAVVAGAWWGMRAAAINGAELLVREAVNDHLRVLYASRPIEIESGGIHQVKPWFSGRIDFAPDVTFSGDDEFPLLGGAVGYVLDRKAATFVFKHRLHTITLLVFRGEQLDWPAGSSEVQLGARRVRVSNVHGFHVLFWQAQGLGHALISDVRTEALLRLCTKLDAEP